MKIIIVGCGKVGYTLAQQLCALEHELTMIDVDSQKLHRVTDSLDAMGIVGDGVDHNVLLEAGIQNADLLVAVTGNDEKNLLCCVIAKKAGHCQTIARIRNHLYNSEADFLKSEFGISMIINSEYTAATEIFSIFQFPFATKVDYIARGNVGLFHFKLTEGVPIIGKKLMNVNQELKCNVLIGTVIRGDEVIIPNGMFVFEEGDQVTVVAQRLEAVNFFKKLGVSKNRVHNAMIAGGGEIALYLARLLLKAGTKVTIIECDKARCEELSVELPEATVIHGDAADQDLLNEEGIEEAEGFASLTGLDEENILLSLYANEVSKAKTVTGVGRSSFNSIINGMNLGSIIYPRVITADYIMKFVRAFNTDGDSEVENLYKLAGGKAEAVEFLVKADSACVGKPLMKLNFKSNTLIGCIYRNHKVIIPTGQDKIKAGDSVLVFLAGYKPTSIKDIFE